MTFNSHRTSLWARAILLAIGKRAKTPCMGFLCTHYICKCKHALNMYSSAHCVLIQCCVCSRPVRTTRRSRILLNSLYCRNASMLLRGPRAPREPCLYALQHRRRLHGLLLFLLVESRRDIWWPVRGTEDNDLVDSELFSQGMVVPVSLPN